ncbi:MAG: redoxin domain-containing protein [Candidatus Latescibacterota bacterium]
MTLSAPRHTPLLLPVVLVVGLLAGTALFLAAKVHHPPPIERLDVEYWDLLGTPVPEVDLETLEGACISSRPFGSQEYLVFVGDPGCPACDEVYPELRKAAEHLPVLLVYTHGLEASRAKAAEHTFPFPVAFDSLEALTDPLRVAGYPTAYWIAADGRIRKAASGNRSSTAVVRLAAAAQEAAP